ncbi:MAG: TonB-dependent receptor plug domain-containing protein, partial [Bacteroidaceae bacterium]|nr:TonB-dependent receptor plug domain-containing protein [Bacteroidaceae bacterium]
MKKYFLLGSLLMMATVASATTLSAAEDAAQVKNAPSTLSTANTKEEVDTLSMRKLQEVQVVSTRALKNAPIAYSSLSKGEIEEINHGKDIPFLLSLSPSVLTSSDAGMGIGYTTMRVRGTDATRINVTTNGIPLNDAESNSLFWVNMPDFASSLNSIELQRGVGTSTNGSGAFGATLNMETEKISADPYFRFDGSAGSYGTHKETL